MTRRILPMLPLLAFALLVAPLITRGDEPAKDSQSASADSPLKSNDNTSNQSSTPSGATTSNGSLPAPTKSGADADSKQPPSRSLLKDSKNDNQTQTTTEGRSSANGNRGDARTNRENARDRGQRDLRAGIQIGQPVGRGLTINTVTRGTVFYDSGLRNGDVIVSYNGRRIRTRDDFDRIVLFQPGQRIPVLVLRNGREQTFYITDRDEIVTQNRSNVGVYFGAEFDPKIEDAAVIIRVDEGSPADRAGLRRDDVVVSFNGKRVSSSKDAKQIIGAMNVGQRLDVEFSRQARAQAVLEGSRDREVAGRPADDGVYNDTRETEVQLESARPETRRSDTSRDPNLRDGNRTDRRGIVPRRRD